MRGLLCSITAILVLMGAAAWALTPEEVVRLKKAGVGEETIRLMLEQERQGGGAPMAQEGDQVIYRAGSGSAADAQRHQQHEAWKEKQSLEALKGMVIDQRSQPAPGTGKQLPGQ